MPDRSPTGSDDATLGMTQKNWLDGSNNLLILCIAKTIRTMGFGAISIILALFLLARGFTTAEIGILLTATLLEDALVTTLAATIANKIGVRTILYIACAAIVFGGIVLAFAELKLVLILAVVCGIVSPAGFEGGPFFPMEQTVISQSTTSEHLTRAYSWYNMVGFGGAAVGALLAGLCVAAMKAAPPMQAYQTLWIAYSIGGVVLALLYGLVKLPPAGSETPVTAVAPSNSDAHKNAVSDPSAEESLEHSKPHTATSDAVSEQPAAPSASRKFIFQLAGLQCVDAFGGGFIVQSLLTLWFYQRFHVDATFLGPVYFCCNVIAALSFLFAPMIVKKVGLLNTMVFTHLPTSLALCLMPFLPTAWLAAGLLLLRAGFSSMDIPVRQAYTMLIVAEKDRPFAAGLTSSTRAIAQGIAPSLTGFLLQNVMPGVPLILAGTFKSIYDISLYFCFKSVPVHQDHATPKVVSSAR